MGRWMRGGGRMKVVGYRDAGYGNGICPFEGDRLCQLLDGYGFFPINSAAFAVRVFPFPTFFPARPQDTDEDRFEIYTASDSKDRCDRKMRESRKGPS